MLALQLLYTISGFIALSAGSLQLIKLLKRKNSDEFNLGTWLMWTCTQTVSTLYVITLKDPLIIIISGLWATFYLIMSICIIRYSSSRAALFRSISPVEKPVEETIPL